MYFQKNQRKKGVVWKVYIDYKDVYGRKHTYTKGGFKTKKQAQEYGEKMDIELKEKGDVSTKNPTFNEMFEDFIKIVAKNKYAPSTIGAYQTAFNCHIKNSIGQCRIKDLRYKEIQDYFNSLDGQGKAINACIKNVMSNTFTFAIQNGYIDENPVQYVKPGGVEKHSKRVETITYEQLQEMIQLLLVPHPNMPSLFRRKSITIAMYISYYSGLRISEVLVLNKSDFDFDTDRIYVDKKLEYSTRNRNDYYVTERMKTKGSKAVLPLANPLKEILIEWFKENPYELVCANEDGEIIKPNTIFRVLKKVGDRMGINFSFHVLRHTFTTNMIKNGVPVETVRKLCRHTNINTTMNIYTHTTQEEMKNSLNSVFNDDFYSNPTQNLPKNENTTIN